MQQIADWLEKLGMSEYAERFAESDVDTSVLRDLTDQDLKELGVSLGHRRKMLRAIAELDSALVAPSAAPLVRPAPILTGATPPPIAVAVEPTGERRYLTVMFCDLVGSTGISAQLDAEEWRDLVGGYLDAASAAVTEMGGHVAKKLGDGLMALFGYPVAHENDSERAARAALSIQRALAELNRRDAGTAKPDLIARIGLESGSAVLDASGEIYGDVANVAARVQALADPGAILVTARVQRQIAGLFIAEERGTHTLKGIPEPTALFRLVRASGGGRRSGQRNLTPLVGRDEEIAALMKRWKRARQGEGQLTLIVGEPGLGKSRLIEEFHAGLSDTPHTWVEWSCSQLLQNTPLHPIAEWGRQRFGGADTPAERRLADLETSLAQVNLDSAENAPLLAPLLEIPLPKERVSTLAPEELRRRQLAALTNWVMAGAKAQPLVLAFEDLHWADPTTLDVLRTIAERGSMAPVYIVATTRPEFRPPWGMRSHHGTISLAPLDRGQVRDMVTELSARHALSRDVVDDVAARTGGVPLFVEEVTRLLLERGEQGGTQAIPPTLQQSLMARLDRLGSAREVAQIGSVIGRGFSYKLLHAVAGIDEAPLEAALEKLSDADILLVEGVLPESDYRFKHALIQDAAYENLLKSRRQVLHRRIAETLRDRFADKAAAEPEVLAHHFTQASLIDAAIEWWGKAGDQALRRSAFHEAIAHLGKAIEMADKSAEAALDPAAARVSPNHRLKLQTSYGRALIWGKGYAAPETIAAYARARDLGTNAGEATAKFETYYGQWAGGFMRGDFASCRDIAAAFVRDAEGAARMPEIAAAHRVLGLTLHLQGDFVDARSHFVEALRVYDPRWDYDTKTHLGPDTGANATAGLARVNWVLGELGQTRELMDDALARAAQSGNIPTLANIQYFKALFELNRGHTEAARHDADQVVQLGRQYELPTYLAWGRVLHGYARACLGDRDTGLVELREGLTAHTEQGNRAWVPYYQGLLAKLEGDGRDFDGALRRIEEALEMAGATSEHENDAPLYQLRAELLLKRDPANAALAEEAFLTAIAIAQEQKAKSFGLRAALSLAKLYQSTGRPADAQAVLAPALAGFSPTPEFPEIAEAQALFAVLAESDDMKTEMARRHRRFRLQTAYSNALLHGRGMSPPETTAAFATARELAASIADPAERFSAYYGLWVGPFIRGNLSQMQEVAEAFMRDAERYPGLPEGGVAHRLLGTTFWYAGDYQEARLHLDLALAVYDHRRDAALSSSFAYDQGVPANFYLGMTAYAVGEFDRGAHLVEESLRLALDGGHVPTIALARHYMIVFAAIRGELDQAAPHAQALLDLGATHGLPNWVGFAKFALAWRERSHSKQSIADMRAALELQREKDFQVEQPLFAACLAEAEAAEGQLSTALATVDKQLAVIQQTGERWFEAELHRVRGEILLKSAPADVPAAEQALHTAMRIAKRQGARGYRLRAALSLAKLYHSTGRPADAQAVLAPALAGFSPTPEFPEIAEAQALLAALPL